MEKKFRALRIIGTIYKIGGVFVAVLTLLGAIGVCGLSFFGSSVMSELSRQMGGDMGTAGLFSGILGGLLFALLVLLNGGMIALTLYATGEGIYLLLSLEENTRATAELLKREEAGPAS